MQHEERSLLKQHQVVRNGHNESGKPQCVLQSLPLGSSNNQALQLSPAKCSYTEVMYRSTHLHIGCSERTGYSYRNIITHRQHIEVQINTKKRCTWVCCFKVCLLCVWVFLSVLIRGESMQKEKLWWGRVPPVVSFEHERESRSTAAPPQRNSPSVWGWRHSRSTQSNQGDEICLVLSPPSRCSTKDRRRCQSVGNN